MTTLAGTLSINEPRRTRWHQFASKTNWVAADLPNTDLYWGPDGQGGLTSNATATNVGLFDAGWFDTLQVLWTGTFANAVTLRVDIQLYSDSDQANAVLVGPIHAVTANNGGSIFMQAGMGTPAITSAADAAMDCVRVLSPAKVRFFRIKTVTSGATGALTTPRMFIYGSK